MQIIQILFALLHLTHRRCCAGVTCAREQPKRAAAIVAHNEESCLLARQWHDSLGTIFVDMLGITAGAIADV